MERKLATWKARDTPQRGNTLLFYPLIYSGQEPQTLLPSSALIVELGRDLIYILKATKQASLTIACT